MPTSKKAYENLRVEYESGRVPYTQLLEAERTLIELSFEHNDMLLAIHKEIIDLERISGVTLRFEGGI